MLSNLKLMSILIAKLRLRPNFGKINLESFKDQHLIQLINKFESQA